MIVGALRPPTWPRTPVANASPFDQPFFGSWQLAQLIVSSRDSRVIEIELLAELDLVGRQRVVGRDRQRA